MPSAAQQTKRDARIRERRACGATIAELAAEFSLGETRIKQILKAEPLIPDHWDRSKMQALAESRLEDYREMAREIREMARNIPNEQASAKTGAYKSAADALDRLVTYEQSLGLLGSHKLVNPFSLDASL